MRKALFIVAITGFALLWMGRNVPASAATFSCQGLATSSLPIGYDESFTFAESAVWTFSPKPGGAFSAGSLTVPVAFEGCGCFYSLNTSYSGSTAFNGFSLQLLDWFNTNTDMCECFPELLMDVAFIGNSSGAGVMANLNVFGDDLVFGGAGSGVCTQTGP